MTHPGYDPWLATITRTRKSRLRLICLPYAGGTTAAFRNWSEICSEEIDISVVRLPGRQERIAEVPFTSLPALVEALVRGLEAHLVGHFAFFGHSVGALIAFELARYLHRQQRPGPMQLFVSGHRAPQLPDRHRPIHSLPTAPFVAELRRLGGTPEEILQSDELLDILLPALRADFALAETYTYVPEAPLDCSISAFGGIGDPDVAEEEIAAWRAQTTGRFVLRMMPGSHFFIHDASTQLVQAMLHDLG